jgi:hypothetical protein
LGMYGPAAIITIMILKFQSGRGVSSVGYLSNGSFDERLEFRGCAAEQTSQRVRVAPEAVPIVVVEHLEERLDLILPHA